MDLGPWEKLAAALAAGIVASLGALRLRGRRGGNGNEAHAALRALRERLDRHIEEDLKAHEKLGAIEQTVRGLAADVARAGKHADESTAGYERLARLEATLVELRRYADALQDRIAADHELWRKVRDKVLWQEAQLEAVEQATGVRKPKRGRDDK